MKPSLANFLTYLCEKFEGPLTDKIQTAITERAADYLEKQHFTRTDKGSRWESIIDRQARWLVEKIFEESKAELLANFVGRVTKEIEHEEFYKLIREGIIEGIKENAHKMVQAKRY